jgi:hypothetical protein
MSCSSRIGAYPALRLAFVRLDDIGSAVAPLTGFLPSIGRSISFYPAILCALFFRSSPQYRMITRHAELSDRAASRYRAGRFGENPRQCGKACRGNQAVSRVTRISPEAPSYVSLTLRKGFEVPRYLLSNATWRVNGRSPDWLKFKNPEALRCGGRGRGLGEMIGTALAC